MKTKGNSQRSALNRFGMLTFISALMLTFAGLFTEANAQPDGKAIFKANCSSCHSSSDKKMTGPGLRGVSKKRSEEWLQKWVMNSIEFVKSGDPDAVAIAAEFNNMPMPPFTLSPEEIKSVFVYVDEVEKTETEQAAKKRVADSLAQIADASAADKEDHRSNIPWLPILVILGVIGGLLFLFLSYVNRVMVDATGKGLPFVDTTENGYFEKMINENRRTVIAIVLIIIMVAARTCWNMLPPM
jgi:mono/diheme cytochrome c family protein